MSERGAVDACVLLRGADSADALRAAFKQLRGECPTIKPFYGHRGVDGFLSNFYQSFVVVKGVRYASGEHALHAAKALLFGDTEVHRAILDSKSTAHAKRLGRQVRGFKEEVWRAQSLDVQIAICRAKMASLDPAVVEKLRTWFLVEASPTDRVWGVGCRAAASLNPERWRGENRLGRAWMLALRACDDG